MQENWMNALSYFSYKIADAGSDLQGIRTRAVKDGDDYILNGNKTFITNGILADVVVVVALTNPDAKSRAHGITLFIVEDGMKGFKKGRNLNKLGLKASDTAELFFEDVRLPETAILGGENFGFYQLMSELPQVNIDSTISMYKSTACHKKMITVYYKTVKAKISQNT